MCAAKVVSLASGNRVKLGFFTSSTSKLIEDDRRRMRQEVERLYDGRLLRLKGYFAIKPASATLRLRTLK